VSDVKEAEPSFELPNARGEKVRLSAALVSAPMVPAFYLGAWRPCSPARVPDPDEQKGLK
jgi:peroxiredoxin